MKQLTALWKFSRPHTVIGSVVSISTLYVIICENEKLLHVPLLLLALLIGIGCNIFIVGINQIADVDIDRINKPELPIAAGEMSVRRAGIVITIALLLSLGLALYLSAYLFAIILLAAGIGWAYSMPPFHWKKHHLTAALSILLVRGLLINIGGFLVFNYLVHRSLVLPADVKILAAFITVFSIVIAWFKDLPDVAGDAQYNIRSLAIVYSPMMALRTGTTLVLLTYVMTILVKAITIFRELFPASRDRLLLYGHLFLLLLFVLHSAAINLQEKNSVRKFYKRFWLFFFAEYLLYFAAYTLL